MQRFAVQTSGFSLAITLFSGVVLAAPGFSSAPCPAASGQSETAKAEAFDTNGLVTAEGETRDLAVFFGCAIRPAQTSDSLAASPPDSLPADLSAAGDLHSADPTADAFLAAPTAQETRAQAQYTATREEEMREELTLYGHLLEFGAITLTMVSLLILFMLFRRRNGPASAVPAIRDHRQLAAGDGAFRQNLPPEPE